MASFNDRELLTPEENQEYMKNGLSKLVLMKQPRYLEYMLRYILPLDYITNSIKFVNKTIIFKTKDNEEDYTLRVPDEYVGVLNTIIDFYERHPTIKVLNHQKKRIRNLKVIMDIIQDSGIKPDIYDMEFTNIDGGVVIDPEQYLTILVLITTITAGVIGSSNDIPSFETMVTDHTNIQVVE